MWFRLGITSFNQSLSVSWVEDSPIDNTMSRIFCFTKDLGSSRLLGKGVSKSDSWAPCNLPVSNEIVLASAGRSGAFGNTASVTLYPATNAAVWNATTGRRISRPNGDLIALMLTAKGEPMQHDVVKSDNKGRIGRINFVTWGRNLQKVTKQTNQEELPTWVMDTKVCGTIVGTSKSSHFWPLHQSKTVSYG